MMKFDYGLSAALIGVTIALVQPQVATALSAASVGKIAQDITVQIEGKNSLGSGVIVKHQGNTYYVLTCLHVVATADKYTVVTPDGDRYSLNYNSVQKLQSGLDLALVQFNSNKNYTVAKLGNSDKATLGTVAYVSGFPEKTSVVTRSIVRFIEGKITANASQPLDDGYALVYDTKTLSGMSGGPVLNKNGELIGVHGKAETSGDIDGKSTSTGFNLGIPINTFSRLSASVGVNLGISVPSDRPATTATADNFFIQAGDKYDKGDYQGAIADLNQALRLNPNYADAYINRGLARSQLGDNRGAIADYNSALRLEPNAADAYYNRGIARFDLGDNRGAVADYNSALRLNPNAADAYYNRGLARFDLGDNRGAVADYNSALRLNPNYAKAYGRRGLARAALGDKQGALADLRRAASLFQQQGNTSLYQYTRKKIAELQQ